MDRDRDFGMTTITIDGKNHLHGKGVTPDECHHCLLAERDRLREALERILHYVEHADLGGEPVDTLLVQAHAALNADSTTEAQP